MDFTVFPGNYTSLQKISHFIKTASKQAGFDGFNIYTIETAVDEACSNIIEHAYGGENIGDIEIAIEDQTRKFRIFIRDHGQPFDPNTIPVPTLSPKLSERKANGLGLFMMHQWMDEVDFQFTDSANLLIMTKFKGE